MNQRIWAILSEIERRREAEEFLYDSCRARGVHQGKVYSDCLGQKILLTGEDYSALLEMADSILNAEVVEWAINNGSLYLLLVRPFAG